MTVASTTSRVQYTGDGVSTAFATGSGFTFKDAADLKVTILSADGLTETVKTLNTHYTVSGGNGASGTVTFTGGNTPATGEKITITRNVIKTQETDYQSNDSFPAESHEQALDKLTFMVQQMQEELQRCIRVPISSNLVNPEIAVPSVGGAFVTWNQGLTGLTNSATLAFASYVEKSASYTFGSDTGTAAINKIYGYNNTGAATFTVPPNATTAFPIGGYLGFFQKGSGQLTIAAGAGVTIYSELGRLKTFTQYSSGCLQKLDTNVWLLTGSMTP